MNTILKIDGELGILVKFALYSGLRGEEISYAHDAAICNSLSGCGCQSLHVMNKGNGHSVIVLNRIVGQKHSYFTIVPTKCWRDFRGLERATYGQRKIAHSIIKTHTDGKASFMDLRKFHYNILCRSALKEQGAEVLAGRVKTISAKHYQGIEEAIERPFEFFNAYDTYKKETNHI